jgi:hypothetical protein
MGVRTELHHININLSADHLQRGVANAQDLRSLVHSAALKIGEAVRDLQVVANAAALSDPGRAAIEAQITALS